MNENEPVRCPNCDASILPSETRCPHCGAKQLPPRVIFKTEREEFTLTAEEEPFDPEEFSKLPVDSDFLFEPRPAAEETAAVSLPAVAWGGFFRRAVALVIDLAVVVALGATMFFLSYIGYKVGLLAHGRSLTWANATALVAFFTWGWIALCAAYFVLFHAMGGQTIGKWLLGLRVIGPQGAAVSYRQALLRWLVEFALAPLLVGFLWAIFSREKRACHDWVANTWVIRT